MSKEFIELPPTEREIADYIITPEQWSEALEYYRSHKNELIEAGKFSRKRAVSHRNPPFQVGCAVIAIEPQLQNVEYAVYQAYNFTPSPGEHHGENKRCAERNALDGARKSAKTIVAIVTTSKEVSTGDLTKAHDPLHPCSDCRDMLRRMLADGFLREDSMICNANDSGKEIVSEEKRLNELLELYKDDPHASNTLTK